MKHRFAGMTVLALLLAGSSARADDWPSLGLDGTRARLSGERGGGTFGPARWEHTLPPIKDAVYRALMASPAVADGYLVYATTSNTVRALDEHTGAVLWQFGTKDSVFASPAIWRGWAYVVDTGRQVYALRLSDGGLAWKRELDGIAYASPVVFEGSVLVTTGEPAPRLVRIDAVTGKVLWRTGAEILSQDANASVTVAEGHVIVGENEGTYHSFSLATGSHEWTAKTGGLVHMSSPLVLNGRVYVLPGGSDGRVHALELTDGKPVSGWSLAVPAPVALPEGTLLNREYVMSSPAVLSGKIVFDRRIEDRLDTNGDGATDSVVLEESVVAIDAADGGLLWMKPNGRLVTPDTNKIPTYGLAPTPALYRSVGGELLAAVASSLSPTLKVVELGSGAERWTTELSGTTRGSPLFANGRLVVGTDAGVIHSFASRTNQAPLPPVPLSPAGGRDADAASVSLRWSLATDPDRETARYEVRLDDDGEVLHDWALSVATQPAQLSLDLTSQLAPGRVYTFSVRARDAQGAWSAWSIPAQFRAVMAPSVQLDGAPVPGLAAALAQARAGSVITLGAGTFPLSATLHLPAGVSLVGAAPHLTTLSGKGLAVAVRAGQGNRLSQLTVTGAAIGVEVTGGEDARLQNVVLRDNPDAGLQVASGAGAEVISVTVARNGTGVRVRGKTKLRNAIVTANTVGIDAADPGALGSRYNDVFGNKTADYQGAQRSETDRSDAVTFATGDDDLRLTKPQATTDQGDPADPFENEPQPNGGRINLGAFGNTPFAELSDPLALPPPPEPPVGERKPPSSSGGLCSLGSGLVPDGGALLVLLALLAIRFRPAGRSR